MGHAGAGLGQDANVLVIDPHHVHQDHVRTHQAHAAGELHGRHLVRLAQELAVGLYLGQVHGDPHAPDPGLGHHLPVELGRHPPRGPGAETDVDPAVGRPVPAVEHVERGQQALLAGLAQPHRHGVVLGCVGGDVHHLLGQAGADAGVDDHLGHSVEAVPMRQARLQKRGGAGPQHLGDAEAGADHAILVVITALQHPHPLAEPLDQRHVVSAIADHRLRFVDVGVDQPGDDQLAGEVDLLLIRIGAQNLVGRAHRRDAVRPRHQRAAAKDPAPGIHRDDRRPVQEHARPPGRFDPGARMGPGTPLPLVNP